MKEMLSGKLLPADPWVTVAKDWLKCCTHKIIIIHYSIETTGQLLKKSSSANFLLSYPSGEDDGSTEAAWAIFALV